MNFLEVKAAHMIVVQMQTAGFEPPWQSYDLIHQTAAGDKLFQKLSDTFS